MGEIRFSGISSGIDTTELVKQLMAVESRRLANYKVAKMGFEKQTTALDELRASITSLKSAAAGLSDMNTIELYNANSSNKDILTASASSGAASGSHTVAVDQLAAADTWIQNTSAFNYKTDYVGGGTFLYSYHNQQRTITAVANETTLEDLVNLINSDENNPGVTASLLYQGGKYHLMLSGQETGQDYQISIDTSSREIWKPDPNQPDATFTSDQNTAVLSTKITDLDQFGGLLGASDKIIISGKNHAGSALPDAELAVTDNTTLGHLIDAINEHFNGTATARLEDGQIWLVDSTTGASGLEIGLSFSGDATLGLPAMAVATEGGSVTESLASVSAASFIETQNANNAKVKIDGFPSGTTNEVQTLSITGGVPTTGTFRLTLNGQTTAAIAHNATAADIQSALLALSGIEAGDVTVTGTDLPAGEMTVTFGGNLAGTDITKMTVSDDSGLDAGILSVTETAKGNDGWIHRNSNSITDALSGINLSLQDVTDEANPVKITVTRNTAAISKKIQALVTAYNTLAEALKSNTEYDSEAKKMGLLSRDFGTISLKSDIRGPFTSIARGFIESMDSFAQADDIGITLDGAGVMEFDTEKFEEAIGDNFKSVLELLGAVKSGSSSHSAVQFYGASTKYTTAGIYHVKITVDASNTITSAQIKLSTESDYRDAASWDGNVIYFDQSFDETGDPTYPEHGLQLTVDLAEGTYGTDANPVVVRMKQGIFGTLEETLVNMLKTDGQLDISNSTLDNKITRMEDRIEKEEVRLERVEDRLIQKYARLEALLSSTQQQMGAVSAMMSSYGMA